MKSKENIEATFRKKIVVDGDGIAYLPFEVLLKEVENDTKLKRKKDNVIKLASYEANYESSPQTILQAYTLWKRPLACFHGSTEINDCLIRISKDF